MNQKTVEKIGWAASILSIAMYISYISQIHLNLMGEPGSVLLPTVTTLNCLVWVIYAYSLKKKNWQLIVCNVPGIILGAITAITAILH